MYIENVIRIISIFHGNNRITKKEKLCSDENHYK